MKKLQKLSKAIFLAVLMVIGLVSYAQEKNIDDDQINTPPPPPPALGLDDEQKDLQVMSIFPNPAQNAITIKYGDMQDQPHGKINILSITGNKVWEGVADPQGQIDISGLRAGIYLLNWNGKTYKFQKV